MKPRSLFTSMSLWGICVLLACVTTSRAVAEDLPKSCQETTERVLKPFLDRLAATEEGARQYEKQTAENIVSIQEHIRLRQESRKVFDDAKAKEDEDFGNRIRWGNEAIAEAQADAQKRIAEHRRLAAEAQATGRQRDAKAHTDAAAHEKRTPRIIRRFEPRSTASAPQVRSWLCNTVTIRPVPAGADGQRTTFYG